MSSTPIVFLKTKNSPTDPYEDYFRERDGHWKPIFVPVLKHELTNLDKVEEVIRGGKIKTLDSAGGDEPGYFGGLLITSQRAVEALGKVLDSMKDFDVRSFLLSTLVYVVGPATHKAVVQLGFQPSNVLGADCGSGAILAPYILATFEPNRRPERKRRLLFFPGDKRSDIIPTLLNAPEVAEADKVQVTEIIVYKTENMVSFPEHFADVMKETESAGPTRWVVVFSPSACETVVETVRQCKNSGQKTYIASIGPTTETYLLKTFGMEPDVVAVKPSPEGLWQGIENFITRLNS